MVIGHARKDLVRRGELACRECLDAHTAYTSAWRRARLYAVRREEAEAAAWRAEHEATRRMLLERDVRALVAVLAEALHEERPDLEAA